MTAVKFGDAERAAAERLIEWGLEEDLASRGDVTCQTVIPSEHCGAVEIRSRTAGCAAGLPIVPLVFAQLDPSVRFEPHVADGALVAADEVWGTVRGPLRALLTGERTALNFLTHLSGIATLTQQFVEQVQGTKAQILDTRKTLPGWRALQKYAVRCGGGVNHRFGLYDAVMLKDNHVADWTTHDSLASAIPNVRAQLDPGIPVIVEVDSLGQLVEVLPVKPDVVLLDNMPPDALREAVALRDVSAAEVLLEASGGITLANVREVAETGVDRISIGALTHSAKALDVGFDWMAQPE